MVQFESEAELDEQDDSRMETDDSENSDLSESSFDDDSEDSFCSDDDDEDVDKVADELSKNYIRYFQMFLLYHDQFLHIHMFSIAEVILKQIQVYIMHTVCMQCM